MSPGRSLAGKGSQRIPSSRKAGFNPLFRAAELSNKCKCLQQTKQFLYLEFTNEMCGILYRAKMWLFPNKISKCIKMGCPGMREAHKNLATSKLRCGHKVEIIPSTQVPPLYSLRRYLTYIFSSSLSNYDVFSWFRC